MQSSWNDLGLLINRETSMKPNEKSHTTGAVVCEEGSLSLPPKSMLRDSKVAAMITDSGKVRLGGAYRLLNRRRAVK